MSNPTQAPSQQYFTFMLAGEEYGIDILKILEIRTLDHLTVLPSSPPFVKGVINLRGLIIPILDLREIFKLEARPYNTSTIVIILQINKEDHHQTVGVVVDAFSDVSSISSQEIKPKPDIADMVGQEFITGLANVPVDQHKSKLIILLDANLLLTPHDWHEVEPTTLRETNEKN